MQPYDRQVSKKTSNSLKKSPASTKRPEWVTVAQNLIRQRDSKIYYLRSKCKGKHLRANTLEVSGKRVMI